MKKFSIIIIAFLIFSSNVFAQQNSKNVKSAAVSDTPKVTQVDEITIKKLLKPNGKPLLINFWATWCVPCQEEFPDLVEIDEEFRGKIDFITITLDDPAEIDRDVPKFLAEMKAKMPTYLLRTTDENGVIGSISKEWQGGLPFTILYDEKGGITHAKQGKINPETVKGKINLLLNLKSLREGSDENITKPEINKNAYAINFDFEGIDDSYKKGKIDAEKDISENRLAFIDVGIHRPSKSIWKKRLEKEFGIYVYSSGCVASQNAIKYKMGYNEVSLGEIEKRFGEGVLSKVLKQAENRLLERVKANRK